MKKNFLTWTVILIAVLPAAYLLLIWSSLPQTVAVHFGLDMKPDRTGEKSKLLLSTGILAIVSVFLYFLLNNLQRFDPKRRDAAQSATFKKLSVGLVVFMAALNFLIIGSAKTGSNIQSLVLPLIGLLFAFMGNYMNNIRPNYFVGFRLPWTLNNDENWRRTHQLGGKLWFVGGLLIAVICLFLKAPASFVFFFIAVLTMVVIPIVYSYRLFKKGF